MTISLDISTSCIGFCIFSDKKELIEMDYIAFNSKHDLFEKLEAFKDKISHLTSFPIKSIVIEEPLKKFKGKFSSAHTLSVLNFFNGMVSSYLYSTFKAKPIYYNVNSARSVVFPGFKADEKDGGIKFQIWKKVVEMEPQVNWKYGIKSRKLLDENFDMVDAYVVGVCNFKMIDIQKEKIKNM